LNSLGKIQPTYWVKLISLNGFGVLKYSILQSSKLLQAGLFVSHGLPIAESRNKVKTLIKKKLCTGGKYF